MAKPKTKFPVSSYDPNLLSVLKEGSLRRVEIKFQTEKRAIHFSHRIHGLRAAMRREGYTGWEQFYRVGVYPHPTDPTIRIVQPRDSEFTDAFEAAGVPLVRADAPALDTNGSAPIKSTGDPAEDFLATLRKGPKLEDL